MDLSIVEEGAWTSAIGSQQDVLSYIASLELGTYVIHNDTFKIIEGNIIYSVLIAKILFNPTVTEEEPE